ncbi:hypothetical protein Tco_1057621 [Tanacetum coccineum]|uniref:Uncharacterized protein n=1 Tax=Tanacetum coccineum TaxID=301880 RepID=A0ABQ5H7B1_9ASTR
MIEEVMSFIGLLLYWSHVIGGSTHKPKDYKKDLGKISGGKGPMRIVRNGSIKKVEERGNSGGNLERIRIGAFAPTHVCSAVFLAFNWHKDPKRIKRPNQVAANNEGQGRNNHREPSREVVRIPRPDGKVANQEEIIVVTDFPEKRSPYRLAHSELELSGQLKELQDKDTGGSEVAVDGVLKDCRKGLDEWD